MLGGTKRGAAKRALLRGRRAGKRRARVLNRGSLGKGGKRGGGSEARIRGVGVAGDRIVAGGVGGWVGVGRKVGGWVGG